MNNLKPCPFCGEKEELQMLNQGDVVGWECHYQCDKQLDAIAALNHSWFVNCPMCGTCGPNFFIGGEDWEERKTDEQCKKKAINAWNRRDNNG